MKRVELTLIILAAFATGLHLIPGIYGSPLILAITFTFLAAFYFIFGFALFNNIGFKSIFKKKCYKNVGTLRILFAILIGMALSATVLGVLFGLMAWYGARPMLYSGLVVTAFSVILLIIEFVFNRSDFYKSVLIRIVIWGAASLFLLLLAS